MGVIASHEFPLPGKSEENAQRSSQDRQTTRFRYGAHWRCQEAMLVPGRIGVISDDLTGIVNAHRGGFPTERTGHIDRGLISSAAHELAIRTLAGRINLHFSRR